MPVARLWASASASRAIRRMGTPLSECPTLDQPNEYGYHRSKRWMHEASDANPIGPTVRLAGFEFEEHDHCALATLARPFHAGSKRAQGQRLGGYSGS